MNLELELPEIVDYLDINNDTTVEMLTALFHRITYNLGATSLTYWLDKFTDHKQGNRMILQLSLRGVIVTTVKHNYAEIEMSKQWLLQNNTQEELDALILSNKLNKYLPIRANLNKPLVSDQVKLSSGIQATGLSRPSFAKAGHNIFTYDTAMMSLYRDEIVKFSIKAMEKMEAKLHRSLRLPEAHDYGSIIEQAIDLIIANSHHEYMLGSLVLDSRGRAIYQCLKTIFNPISNKMARALVKAPGELVTADSAKGAFLFIAEIYSGFNPNIPAKIEQGIDCYADRLYHEIDADTEEGLDSLFENIWLERLYADMEAFEANPYHLVTTPLEVDFSASNLTIIGLLLGHTDYVDDSRYMWDIDGLSKNHVKFAQTPYVFGSSASIKSLWAKNKLDFTATQVDIMRTAQLRGKFAIANEFKDIIINHCHPTAVMEFHIADEKFRVECNKTKNIGETTKSYIVLDSISNKFNLIQHTNTHKTPDLKQFRRYPVTGIIHNRDSWLLDFVFSALPWGLPIHDAGIVTWSGATTMRNKAVEGMTIIHSTRQETVYNYLKSINLDTAGLTKYAKLLGKVADLNKDKTMTISPYLLK